MNNLEFYIDEVKEAIDKKELSDFALEHGLEHYDVYTFVHWLVQEHKEEILTKSEKEYLSYALHPFKKVFMTISKHGCNNNFEFIAVHIKSQKTIGEKETMHFPPFKKGTMYKNMALGICYTPEELGL